MVVSQRFTTSLLQSAATIWAGALMLCGLAMLFGAGGWIPVELESSASPLRGAFGVTALFAAQVVFMWLVADRAFPNADRRFVLRCETAACVMFGAGLVWVVWSMAAIIAGGGS